MEQIGRYEIIETLARGGMGVVYKARDPLIDRVVAIKTLGQGLSPLEAVAFRKRFAREAKSAGRLNHPNIVTIHDMGESDDGAYIAMEFLEGRSLRDLLDSGVVLPTAHAAWIVAQVAEGLAFAHQHGVVHCDIKPGNIMVLDNGAVKITDFGIAQLPTGSRTFAGNVLGSPRYISPEQIVGGLVDARSDVFALGAVLYETLTGFAPFAGEGIDEILYQVINVDPQPPSQRNHALPAAFDDIVARAMAKDPLRRYGSAAEIAAALRPLAEPLPAPLAAKNAAAAAVIPAQPGSETVAIALPEGDGGEAHPQPGRGRLRSLLRHGLPATLLAGVIGWALIALLTGGPSDDAPQGHADALATQARAVLQPTVIPPLDGRISDVPALVPPLASAQAEAAPAQTATPAQPRSGSNALARLAFAVTPWGEVLIDGRKRGVAPPLTEVMLPPGKYEVEIRNSTFAPYRQTVELFADAPLRIKHKFQ